ncbi:MAG: hypothetical protein HPY71_10645 [Firmicutes bacterium]|nr:hypothetical protein [Bacillota bacterium]
MIKSVEKCRDVTIIKMRDGSTLVIACDSLGGIGPKAGDAVKVPGYVVGRFTARVPLMEVMATGATPVLLVDTLSVEMDPLGLEILRGIRDEVAAAGLEGALEITGSTEENIATVQTALGVTVIGSAPNAGELRIGTSKPRDVVVCIGMPKVGCEVRLGDPELADPGLIRQLLQLDYIHDILPVGSRGIEYEANVMAGTAGLGFRLLGRLLGRAPAPAMGHPQPIDLKKSAGPATCLLVSMPWEPCENELCRNLARLRQAVSRPVTPLGFLIVSEMKSHPRA